MNDEVKYYINKYIALVYKATCLGHLLHALRLASNGCIGNNNMEIIYDAATEHISKTRSIWLELRLHEVDTETDKLIDQINKFDKSIIDWVGLITVHCHNLLQKKDQLSAAIELNWLLETHPDYESDPRVNELITDIMDADCRHEDAVPTGPQPF
jgi:hypothetical protein